MLEMMTMYEVDPNQVKRKLRSVDTIDPEELLITPEVHKKIWEKRLNIMVQKIKEISSSAWAAPVLLSILIGYTVYSNQASKNTLDKQDAQIAAMQVLLIKLETLHDVEERNKLQERQEKLDDKKIEETYREKMNRDFQRLELIVQGRYPNSVDK